MVMTQPHRARIKHVPPAVTVQWDNGLAEVRRPGDKRFSKGHVGFYLEVGRDPGLDAVLKAAGWPQITIRHPRQGSKPVEVVHWDLGERIDFFPLTLGPATDTVAGSLSPQFLPETLANGIGIAWPSGSRSRMAVRGYLRTCPPADATAKQIVYPALVQITVHAKMTDVLLAALADHQRACEATDSIVDRGQHPREVMPWEIAMPLGAGEEQSWGSSETTTVVPLMSLHPKDISAEYVAGIWRPNTLAQQAELDWPDISDWAATFNSVNSAQGRAPTEDDDVSGNGTG
jgi:hypothetical protein